MYTPSYSVKGHASLVCSLLFSSALAITGCASTEPVTGGADLSIHRAIKVNPVDPYEGFNRSMYGFNMGFDKYLLKPVADGYRFVTPDFMQSGVTNFFNNLKGISVVLNDLLQGKFEQSASDWGRFLANTTIGIGGLFDVATEMGLEANIEDFGQTLAVWGVDQGPYLVLPFLGPTTLRDGGGVIIDRAANPSTYVIGTGVLEGINDRANAESALNFIDEAALDPYVFTRESFLQYRNNLINDGKTEVDSLDLDVEAAFDEVDSNDSVDSKKKTDSAPEVRNDSNELENTEQKASNNSATSQAFDEMSKSFDDALLEFEQASVKMDQLSKKKRWYKRR